MSGVTIGALLVKKEEVLEKWYIKNIRCITDSI
jgi:hypothetical protein